MNQLIALRQFEAVFENGSIRGQFDPAFLTPEKEDQILNLPEGKPGDEPNRELMKCYDGLILEWDLEDNDGTAIPANAEGFYRVGWAFLNACITAIKAASRPNPQSETPSPTG